MKETSDFTTIVEELKKILRPYEKTLVLAPPSNGYSLNTRHIMANKQPLFFAGVQPRKGYVSYYLMPVYVYPDLLNGMSDALRKRMQGKSCFNFKVVDAELFKELAALTKAGFERYEKEGMLA
jgi:hypothetical protein